MINLPDYYCWRHDEEPKKFVSRCAATKGLYFYLGHNVKFEDPSSSATASSPAATTNAAENTQQSSTIATNTTASTASDGNPPSTPNPRRNTSSRPQRVTPSPVKQQDNIETEINNSIFEVKPVWDCCTARRLFNLPDNVDIKNEVDSLGDKLLKARTDSNELLKFLPSNARMSDLNGLSNRLRSELHLKCLYLGRLYKIAVRKYGWTSCQVRQSEGKQSWEDCCKEAIRKVKEAYGTGIGVRKLQLWNKVF